MAVIDLSRRLMSQLWNDFNCGRQISGSLGPGTRVHMGRGVIAFGGREKTATSDCVATPEYAKRAVEERASKLA
jgi:hypothetical protein